jgi:hypothetical protein
MLIKCKFWFQDNYTSHKTGLKLLTSVNTTHTKYYGHSGKEWVELIEIYRGRLRNLTLAARKCKVFAEIIRGESLETVRLLLLSELVLLKKIYW